MNVREKLVEQLRWWSAECDRTNFGCQARKLLVEAADYIANGVTVQEWISVEDRLPEPYMAVLVWDGQDMGEARWEGDIFEWVSDENIAFATHWMPLPEPPSADMRGDA